MLQIEEEIKILDDTKKIYKTLNSRIGKGYLKVLDSIKNLSDEERIFLLKKVKGKSLALAIIPKSTLNFYSRKIRSELEVVTDAKRIMAYCFDATNKAPAKFRFTYIIKLQNYSISILEKIYMSNTYRNDIKESARIRNSLQREAFCSLKMLSYFAYLAVGQKCLVLRQYVHLSKLINLCTERLIFWMEKDKTNLKKC